MNFDFQLTKRQLKEFASLDEAKGRRRTGLFVAEGSKCVLELAVAFRARYVFAAPEWLDQYAQAFATDTILVPSAPQVLRQLTRLNTTPQVVAYYELPEEPPLPLPSDFEQNLYVALDRVQDPGNMGTILRTCDWMGVRTVLASPDTVDAFNPKVVQATMGALARVKVVYTELVPFLKSAKMPVYGTFLDGDDIYRSALSSNGIIVMGNEGRGISSDVAETVTRRLFIPPYPADATAVESLNVATATAIVLSQFRGRNI